MEREKSGPPDAFRSRFRLPAKVFLSTQRATGLYGPPVAPPSPQLKLVFPRPAPHITPRWVQPGNPAMGKPP